MKRFDRLEFEPSQPDRTQETIAEPDENRDEHYWLRKADSERREGFYENALRYYSRALEVNKSVVEAWLGQVQMLIALGEYPEAELWSRKALELFKNHGDLLAGRAHALSRIGNATEALKLSDASFRQEGQSPYRWIARGEIMLAAGESVEQHCFDKAYQLDSDWLVALEIALIYRFRKKASKAVTLARQAVEKAPDRPYCWYIEGCCEMDLNLLSAAKRSFLQCLELKPGHLDARKELTELEADQWSIRARLKRFFRWR